MLYSRNPRISFAPMFSAKRPSRRRIPLQFGAKWMAAPVSLANWDCSKSWKVSVSSNISSLVASTYCHFMALLAKCDSRRKTSNSSTCDKDFQRRFGLGLFLDCHIFKLFLRTGKLFRQSHEVVSSIYLNNFGRHYWITAFPHILSQARAKTSFWGTVEGQIYPHTQAADMWRRTENRGLVAMRRLFHARDVGAHIPRCRNRTLTLRHASISLRIFQVSISLYSSWIF